MDVYVNGMEVKDGRTLACASQYVVVWWCEEMR